MASKDVLSELVKLGATRQKPVLEASPIEEAPKVAPTGYLLTEVCNKAVEALDRSIRSQQELREALLELAELCTSDEDVEIPIDVDESQL